MQRRSHSDVLFEKINFTCTGFIKTEPLFVFLRQYKEGSLVEQVEQSKKFNRGQTNISTLFFVVFSRTKICRTNEIEQRRILWISRRSSSNIQRNSRWKRKIRRFDQIYRQSAAASSLKFVVFSLFYFKICFSWAQRIEHVLIRDING